MKERGAFAVTLLAEEDGSIKACRLELITRNKIRIYRDVVLNTLSKREVEYLIHVLATARKDMQYTEDEPRVFEDVEIRGLEKDVPHALILLDFV